MSTAPMVETIHERPKTVTALMIRDEYSGEEFEFTEALINTCGGNFTMDEDKEESLDNIRDSLMANSSAVHRLIKLRPDYAKEYWKQHSEAEEELKERILKLNIIGVFKQP